MPAIKITSNSWSNGLICLLLGMALLPKVPMLGLLSLLIGLVLSTTYQGIEVDVAYRRYRTFYWLLGYHAGRWNPLPATSRVVLKPHSDMLISRSGSMAGTSSAMRYHHLTLLLSVPGSVIGEVMTEFELYQRERAIATGQWLADLLAVPLVVLEGV